MRKESSQHWHEKAKNVSGESDTERRKEEDGTIPGKKGGGKKKRLTGKEIGV